MQAPPQVFAISPVAKNRAICDRMDAVLLGHSWASDPTLGGMLKKAAQAKGQRQNNFDSVVMRGEREGKHGGEREAV